MPQALRPFTLGLLLAATCVTVPDAALAAKKKVPELADLSATAPGEVMDKGLAALRAGDSKLAIHAFAELAAREPRNGTAQALLGLSYQLSADRNPQALDLALAGYDLAARAEPGQYWPAAMAGRGAFDQGKYDDALNHFSRAALLRPSDAATLSAVAASAYPTFSK